ncbi:hypothetical protein D3C76_484710 [compost metagenome]
MCCEHAAQGKARREATPAQGHHDHASAGGGVFGAQGNARRHRTTQADAGDETQNRKRLDRLGVGAGQGGETKHQH